MATAAAPRRSLRTRDTRWAVLGAKWLAARGVRPNPVSVMSVVFSALAGTAFIASASSSGRDQILLLVCAALLVQLRLLCNMLDGMLAVEGGLKSALGDIYNDLPDRIADSLILVGAGYSISASTWGPLLGWSAALLAVITAYVRLLAGALGATQHFCGPMAKQHRMFAVTIAALVGAVEAASGLAPRAMLVALVVIVAGSAITAARRVRRTALELEAR